MRRLLLILVLAATLAATWAPPAHSADVYGDDAGDRYVGTGGLIVPGSVDHPTRVRVARCPGCAWRLAVPCAAAPPAPGALMSGQPPVNTCTSVVRGCPHGQLLRTWFDDGSGAWTDLGVACYPETGPITVSQIEKRAFAAVASDLPTLSVHAQPERGILVQIPVVFDTAQPAGPFTAVYQLLGQRVRVVARPRWTWHFGDGGSLATDQAGGRYPNLSVSHAYRRAGVFDVTVEAAWSGQFELDGLGSFPVARDVHQEQGATVRVAQGRAVLAVR